MGLLTEKLSIKKLPIIAFLALSYLAQPDQVVAVEYSVGNASLAMDTQLSWGAIFRTESPTIVDDNVNDGNLNFDTGLVSNVFKATTDFQMDFSQYGLFARATAWYDSSVMDASTDGAENRENGLANSLSGEKLSPAVKERAGSSLEILDFYLYSDTEFFDKPVSVRLGRQVINWGEGLFFRDGINTINPADLSKLNFPGAEIKEALIPLNALYVNFGVTDTFNVEAYYQFEWKSSEIEPVGTFFSSTDIFGIGGSRAIASFEGTDLQLLMDALDETSPFSVEFLNNLLTEEIRFGSAGASFKDNHYYVQVAGRIADENPKDDGQYGIALRYIADWLNSTEFAFYYVNYHSHIPRISAFLGEADGLANAARIPELELAGFDLKTAIGGLNVINYLNSTRYLAVYPEDIKMAGFSFNTTVGETSVAGEISHRPDMPIFTSDETNLLASNIIDMAIPLANGDSKNADTFSSHTLALADQIASQGSLDPINFNQDLIAQGIPELSSFGVGVETLTGNLSAGSRVDLWDRKPVTNGSILTIHAFGPLTFLGLDNLMNLTEIGFSHVGGLGESDIFRSGEGNVTLSYEESYAKELERVAVARLSPETSDDEKRFNANNIVEDLKAQSKNFLSDFSWGYQTIWIGEINNVWNGWNLQPIVGFQHDVKGNAYRTGSFSEGRKSHQLSLQANYSDLQFQMSYTEYYGDGIGNVIRDRDNLSLSANYVF